MTRLLKICALIILVIISCKNTSNYEKIKIEIKDYVSERLDQPESLEDVSFSDLVKTRYLTTLDSTVSVGANIKNEFDYKGFEKYVDTLNLINPQNKEDNLRDLAKIKSGKLDFFTINYKFRITKNGKKILKLYEFKLDSTNKIIEANDISDEIEIIN